MRDDEEFTFSQLDSLVSELDPHPTAPNEEEFIFAFVVMPRKDALELHNFDFLTIQLPNDLWAPMFGEGRKFLLKIYLFHPAKCSTAISEFSFCNRPSLSDYFCP